ncbi:nucleotidyltransferase family protein [Flavobacteriaceae bacterium XHP0103]|uniref:nucleotidyltransferase family protein n=1 Tax=Marixanthotalea marina TaxID=2844359 RepID=UPI002989EAED|nr:nucleotidyltransferase family protein [Marixanthotalea marina]MBU3821666.1 nucleotidyltransferase family protein [Marixanthotalea marina]
MEMIDSQSNIAVVVLAAGASSRMGEPKQLLNWGQTTLLGHAINMVKSIYPQETILVLGANFELISKEIKDKTITILNNTDWQHGLGTSIAFAVQHLQNSNSKVSGVLFVLCDQPFITGDYLKQMISKFNQNTHQIIATAYVNGKQGVPVLFDACYFKDLTQLHDDFGAKALLKKHESKTVVLKPPTENVDLDTKEDYTNLYQSKFKK